jgi:hypothetical protein
VRNRDVRLRTIIWHQASEHYFRGAFTHWDLCKLIQPTRFTQAGIAYEADVVKMLHKRAGFEFSTSRCIRRVEDVTRHSVPLPTWKDPSVHELIASQPLVWAAQPIAVVAPTSATARTNVSDVSTASTAATGTTVFKYELHGGAALNTDVTMDNVMFSIATALYTRHRTSSRCATVWQVDVYCNPATQARYAAKRQEFAAQSISTAETWVFHGTKCTANVYSIMAEGFKVRGT